jgi:hypothetical protein
LVVFTKVGEDPHPNIPSCDRDRFTPTATLLSAALAEAVLGFDGLGPAPADETMIDIRNARASLCDARRHWQSDPTKPCC